ncbi:MAG: hypothetical protein LBM02_05895 [Lachnospiraceae bacterium]|nr:hypothetical protein [Lachnospiraceae bacterium]
MRFNNVFNEYKRIVMLEKEKKPKRSKCLLYEKVFTIVFAVSFIASVIFTVLALLVKNQVYYNWLYICSGLMLAEIVAFVIADNNNNRKNINEINNKELMKSNKRILEIKLILKKFSLDFQNEHTIDKLISQAEENKLNLQKNNHMKDMKIIISTILTQVMLSGLNNIFKGKVDKKSILVFSFVLLLSFAAIVIKKYIDIIVALFQSKYPNDISYYNEFIYDLKQLKDFNL